MSVQRIIRAVMNALSQRNNSCKAPVHFRVNAIPERPP